MGFGPWPRMGHRWVRGLARAFPITAITRDDGDDGDPLAIFPVIPCYLPVRSLFRIRREICKCHGNQGFESRWGPKRTNFSLLFSLLPGNLGPAFFPVNG